MPGLRKRGGGARCKHPAPTSQTVLAASHASPGKGGAAKVTKPGRASWKERHPGVTHLPRAAAETHPGHLPRALSMSSVQVGHTGCEERLCWSLKTSNASTSRRPDSQWPQWACGPLGKNFRARRPASVAHRLCVQAHVSVLRTCVLEPEQRSRVGDFNVIACSTF